MPKIRVLSYNTIGPRSILATARLARFLSGVLGAPIMDRQEHFDEWEQSGELYDAIFIINGIPLYCNYRESLYKCFSEHAQAGKKIFWVGQDYNGKMMPQTHQYAEMVASPNFKLLAAFERAAWGNKAVRENQYEYIDWNALTYDPLPELQEHLVNGAPIKPKINGLLYYGAARSNRFHKFEQYYGYGKGAGVERYFSASSALASGSLTKRLGKQVDGTENFEVDFNWVSSFNINNVSESISNYAASLHIEDEANAQFFCSLPNRVYEIISSGSLLLIDKDCVQSYLKSGYQLADIEPLVVSSMEDVGEKLENFTKYHDFLYRESALTKVPHFNIMLDKVESLAKAHGLLD